MGIGEKAKTENKQEERLRETIEIRGRERDRGEIRETWPVTFKSGVSLDVWAV